MSDDVRIRAEGACEVLEAASSRFRDALEKWRGGRPNTFPRLSTAEADALESVKRLDATHVSVTSLQHLRDELGEATAAWVERFGFTPEPDQLPVRFSGSMWSVRLLPLRANVVVTARELFVNRTVIAFDAIHSIVIEAGTHLIVKHADGTATLTPDDEAEFETLRASIPSPSGKG